MCFPQYFGESTVLKPFVKDLYKTGRPSDYQNK
jgi:hypothetical protein